MVVLPPTLQFVVVDSAADAKVAQALVVDVVLALPLMPISRDVNQVGHVDVEEEVARRLESALKIRVALRPEPTAGAVPVASGASKLPPEDCEKIIFTALAPAGSVAEVLGLADVEEVVESVVPPPVHPVKIEVNTIIPNSLFNKRTTPSYPWLYWCKVYATIVNS